MCLRCGVVEYPYWSWPSGPAGPGDYGSPPDASPPEYGAAPTSRFFGIGARGRDYRMTTGRWDRAAPSGEHPHQAARHPLASHEEQVRSRRARAHGRGSCRIAQAVARPSESTIGER